MSTETYIACSPDEVQLKRIEEMLGNIAYKAPTILKDAANATGKKAMKGITAGIEKGYDTDAAALNLKANIRRKSATYAHPETTISTGGYAKALYDFYVNPRSVAITGRRPNVYHARVIRSGPTKVIMRSGYKGFVARMNTGHVGVFVRIKNEDKQNGDNQNTGNENGGKKREKIAELYTTALPWMAGKMYRKDEDAYIIDLKANVKKYVNEFLQRKAKYDT